MCAYEVENKGVAFRDVLKTRKQSVDFHETIVQGVFILKRGKTRKYWSTQVSFTEYNISNKYTQYTCIDIRSKNAFLDYKIYP